MPHLHGCSAVTDDSLAVPRCIIAWCSSTATPEWAGAVNLNSRASGERDVSSAGFFKLDQSAWSADMRWLAGMIAVGPISSVAPAGTKKMMTERGRWVYAPRLSVHHTHTQREGEGGGRERGKEGGREGGREREVAYNSPLSHFQQHNERY